MPVTSKPRLRSQGLVGVAKCLLLASPASRVRVLWEWMECLSLTMPQVDGEVGGQMAHCDAKVVHESMPPLFTPS